MFNEPYQHVDKNLQTIIFDLMCSLEKGGAKVVIAGGALRDWKINNIPSDIDLFLTLDPEGAHEASNLVINLLQGWAQTAISTTSPYSALMGGTNAIVAIYNRYTSYVNDKDVHVGHKFQLIFVSRFKDGLLTYKGPEDFVNETFDFKINQAYGYVNRARDRIEFNTIKLQEDLDKNIITFNLSKLMNEKEKLKNIPERSARFQEKLPNFNIVIE